MKIVTSFPGNDPTYNRMLDAWDRIHLPQIRYHHDLEEGVALKKPEQVEYKALEKVQEHQDFYARFGQVKGQTPQGYNYRYDAAKFTHKIWAIYDAAKESNGWLIWLDADVQPLVDVDESFFSFLNPEADLVYLSRQDINYAETSFIAFNMDSEATQTFVRDLAGIYISGEFLNYKELHDGFIFERLLNIHVANGLKAVSLTPTVKGLDAFGQSLLAKSFTHYKGNKKQEQQQPQQQRIVVEPKDCVANDILDHNFELNSKLLKDKKWLKMCNRHNGVAICLSAGPSLEKNIGQIKQTILQYEANGIPHKIFAVKHAYPTLLKYGILPHCVVLLDPRPFDEASTTGHKRSDLIKDVRPEVTYMIATMTDPKVTTHLLSSGANVVAFDAFTGGLAKKPLPDGRFFIIGGTCAAMRMISIAHTLGFRDFQLWGYDGSYAEKPKEADEIDEKGRPKAFTIRVQNDPLDREFYATGEWMALAQDFEQMIRQMNTGVLDISMEVHGDGFLSTIFNHGMPLAKKAQYTEIL